MDDIRAVVRKFVLDSLVGHEESSELTDDLNLKESGILDSFSTLNLVSFVEDEFRIQIEVADMESGSLFSISSIENLVVARRGLQQ